MLRPDHSPVEIPAIQNATAFDFKCGAETLLGVSCVFYYTIQVNVTEGETWYLWAQATSAAEVSLFGGDTCSSDAVHTLSTTRMNQTISITTVKLTICSDCSFNERHLQHRTLGCRQCHLFSGYASIDLHLDS